MTRKPILLAILAGCALVTATVTANDGARRLLFFAELKGENETPASVSTPGRGRFKAIVDTANQTIDYELSYRDLQQTPNQAHIHIGQRHTSGGVVLFLCGNPPSVPPAAFPQPPECPVPPATIKGQLTVDNIIPVASQGIAAGDFDEIIELMKDGNAYANVHSLPAHPAGEVRGQIESARKF